MQAVVAFAFTSVFIAPPSENRVGMACRRKCTDRKQSPQFRSRGRKDFRTEGDLLHSPRSSSFTRSSPSYSGVHQRLLHLVIAPIHAELSRPTFSAFHAVEVIAPRSGGDAGPEVGHDPSPRSEPIHRFWVSDNRTFVEIDLVANTLEDLLQAASWVHWSALAASRSKYRSRSARSKNLSSESKVFSNSCRLLPHANPIDSCSSGRSARQSCQEDPQEKGCLEVYETERNEGKGLHEKRLTTIGCAASR
jgi:hypothetical protein